MEEESTEAEKEIRDRLCAIAQEKGLMEFMFNLYDRWLDEQKHEDFTEYKSNIRQRFSANGYEVKTISENPLSVEFEMDEHSVVIKCELDGEYIDTMFGVYFPAS